MSRVRIRWLGFIAGCVLCVASASGQQSPSNTEPNATLRREQDADTPLAIFEESSSEDTSGSLRLVGDTEERAENIDIEAILKRLEKLEKEDAKRKAADAKAAAAKKIDDVWTDVSNEKWTVKLGGHVQLDWINWAHADPAIHGPAAAPGAKDYFEYRRVRLLAEGTGYGMFDFRLQMTLEPESEGTNPPGIVTSPSVKDAYFSINDIPWLGRVRIGNFFVPFSLEQVTNDSFNVFLERSIPTQGVFAADRQVGLATYNTTNDQRIAWACGAFFDNISDTRKERIDDNQGVRVSGRVTWLPYYDEPSNGRYLVHTGAGILFTQDQDKKVTFSTRPSIHEGPRLINSGAIPAGSYTTGNLEFATVWGAVTVQSEAFVTNVNRLAGDSINVYGAYAHVSYFLTGENRIYERFGQHGAQFGRSAPYNNAFAIPGSISLGAWEAKSRWSYLDLSSAKAGQYNDLTTGFNWYLSDRVRIMFDWIHPFTSSGTTFGSTQSDLIATRFDFSW